MAAYLPAAFLLLPAYKGERRVTWFSYAPAIAICALTLFMAYQGRSLVFGSWVPVSHAWQLFVAVAIFLLILDAARRSGGYIFLGIVLFLGLYPVFAQYMPGILWGPPSTLSRTIAFNVFSGDAMLGVVTRVVGELIIGFLSLAALMVATGAADFFLQLAMALMGQARGGPAKVSVLASGFFGSLSGSIFGNVVSTGFQPARCATPYRNVIPMKAGRAMTSRDNQDVRHCAAERQARSGWPRWKNDATRPPASRHSASRLP